MPDKVPQIRVFLSSPGDVAEERKIALSIIDRLPDRPTFRNKVSFRPVAWDIPGADTAMRATLTPQEAINSGLPQPSECDIVIVIFWSRMGTPFKDENGTLYQSGTHWELLDALSSERSRNRTIIYRRNDEVSFRSSDEDGEEHRQYQRLQEFFASSLFFEDGQIKRGVNQYRTLDEFRQKFETHFEELVVDVLKEVDETPLKEDNSPTQDFSDYPIWLRLIACLLPGENKPDNCRLSCGIVLSGIISFIFFTLLIPSWIDSATQLCGTQNFITCGLYGPPPPSNSEFIIVIPELNNETSTPNVSHDISSEIAQLLKDTPDLQDYRIIGVDDAHLAHWYPLNPIPRQISGSTAEERRAMAEQVSQLLNADIVLYGTLQADSAITYTPELYIPALETDSPDVAQFLELDLITEDIRITSGESNIFQFGNLPARLAVTDDFSQAMARYDERTYTESIPYFQSAVTHASDHPDMALLYVLMGNAAGRAATDEFDVNETLDFYTQALELKPNYPRALIGIGDVLQFQVLSPTTFNPEYVLPFGTNCLDFSLTELREIDDEDTAFNLLAVDCYQKALALTTTQDNLDSIEASIRATLQLGTVYAWQANFTNNWQQALMIFNDGIDLYEANETQIRGTMHETAGHLYGRYAIVQLRTDQTCSSREEAAISFNQSIVRLDDDQALAYQDSAESNCEALRTSCNLNVSTCDN